MFIFPISLIFLAYHVLYRSLFFIKILSLTYTETLSSLEGAETKFISGSASRSIAYTDNAPLDLVKIVFSVNVPKEWLYKKEIKKYNKSFENFIRNYFTL
tara:strand:+ start:402 stop:701 length:300 start_codon:yes stop_codon:yes gene_type:complete